MDQEQQSRWRPTRRQLLWASGIVAVLTGAVLVGYRYDITLWDWIKLLIVPAVIGGGGLWFNSQQREREHRLANDRAQDEALQAYLDQIGQLLFDKDRPLRQSKEGEEVQTLARARTLTVLSRLDGVRRASVFLFLYESGLISSEGDPVVSLKGADLRGAYLKRGSFTTANLAEVNLQGAHLEGANLQDANLAKANLRGAHLGGASLYRANLEEADLEGANCVEEMYPGDPKRRDRTGAILQEANLRWANLKYADLRIANLCESNLERASLNAANLEGAMLDGASLYRTQMRKTNLYRATFVASYAKYMYTNRLEGRSFEGATMPNGQKYEDWIKDKERSGDEENE